VEELANLNRQLEAARRAGKRTRLGITIVILLIILGFGAALYSVYANFDMSKFQAQVRVKMLDPKTGTLGEFLEMGRRLLPVYQEEVQSQLGKEWPNIRAKLQGEAQLFANTIAEKAEAKVKDRLAKIAQRQEARITAEFPQLKDEKTRDIVMANLEKALQGAVLDVFEDRANKAQDQMVAVFDNMVKFLPEGSRESFQARMSKVWEQFLLYDLGGAKQNP